MKDCTELRVLDIARLARTKTRIVLVEILKGLPSLNMHLVSLDTPARWQLVSFGTIPAEFVLSHPGSMNLGIVNLEEGNDIRRGTNLFEAS